MAELLVRVIDKVNEDDPALNLLCLKRGDVVTVQEDGWLWSGKELAGNPWTVIRFPGASVDASLPYLVSLYRSDDPEHDQGMVLPRASYFDLDSALVVAGQSTVTITGGDAVMLSYKVDKT